MLAHIAAGSIIEVVDLAIHFFALLGVGTLSLLPIIWKTTRRKKR